MSSTYSPSAVRLTDIQLIADGDPKDAAGINTPIEAVADGVEFLNEAFDSLALKAERGDVFTANGTWTCPPAVFAVNLNAYGGGGAGANGGAGTDASASHSAPGGGGGGGAVRQSRTVIVVPGVVYAVTIGAGGSTAGADGASTTFGSLATFVGGGGGRTSTASTSDVYTAGGTSIPTDTSLSATIESTSFETYKLCQQPGSGGWGANNGVATAGDGRKSLSGSNGGSGGTRGAVSGGYDGGGGGGGGGAGPGGKGGDGGNGGIGGGGTSSNGTAGTPPAANSGAGGGGGGGGGSANFIPGTAGAGGAGGSGKLTVSYYGPQAVVT